MRTAYSIEKRNLMRILCIGDVTSPKGVEHLRQKLWSVRKAKRIDFCIVNAENASIITGASAEAAEIMFSGGADCLTGGNHTLRNKTVYTYLDDTAAMLRPINFGDGAPGHGYTILDCNGYRIMVINAMGNVGIEPVLDNPYSYIDRALEREKGNYDIAVLDIHAEATGEKVALGYAYDGVINVVFGTHTHVPTCDGTILPNGTGYISDVGMCGESGGILGMDPALVIKQMRTRMPVKFEPAKGAPTANGVIFEVNMNDKKVIAIERIKF